MTNGVRPRGGPGCLGLVVGTLVLAAVIALVLVVGVIVLGVVAGLVVAGLVVLGVDRLLLALSPKRRQRRAERGAAFTWQFGRLSSGTVIDATATEATVADTRAIGSTAETDGPPGDAGPGAPEAE
jgi:hypothetical protein